MHELFDQAQLDLHEERVRLDTLDEDDCDLALILLEYVIVLLPHFKGQEKLVFSDCHFEGFNNKITVILDLTIFLF